MYRRWLGIIGRKLNIKEEEAIMIRSFIGSYNNSPENVHSVFKGPDKYRFCSNKEKSKYIKAISVKIKANTIKFWSTFPPLLAFGYAYQLQHIKNNAVIRGLKDRETIKPGPLLPGESCQMGVSLENSMPTPHNWYMNATISTAEKDSPGKLFSRTFHSFWILFAQFLVLWCFQLQKNKENWKNKKRRKP